MSNTSSYFGFILIAASSIFAVGAGAATLPCIAPEATVAVINKDTCVSAHVYDVVQLRSGTRFLDVCSPQTSNANCRFTIISLPEDARDVGPLEPLKGTDIRIRGHVRDFSDHREIALTHVRQLHGGPEKFRPNPELLQRFSASEHSLAFRDPNTRGGGSRGGSKPQPLNIP
jgi:hypothetical protein